VDASLLGRFTAVPLGRAAGAMGAAGGARTLAFRMQDQEQSEWCWAAVASSICSYYAGLGSGTSLSQCEIATKFLGMQCCGTPPPPGSNQTFTLELPLQSLGHLGADTIDGPIDMSTIIAQIDRGRPICCHLDFGDGQGHFVAIIGYDMVNDDVVTRDPLGTSASGILPLNGATTFPGGSWTETYLTK
jgi:Peptidase_C39 like family